MNGRLKLIEQQLLGIDSAAFQNLCDVYLFLREQKLTSINRTGSQLGKQKTIKGTPDTFFRLNNGNLRYVEYTTKADNLVDKIKEDIDKCLDSTKTGVLTHEVHKIIICFNSRLDLLEETVITKYADSKGIRIELVGLDWLALEIYSKYLVLAKDILGISLDTGQLLPLQNFIEEYNNKAGNLSTPLDNKFLHRKSELVEIKNILTSNDILIISGFPGVGKTKIAVEALTDFLSSNKDYLAFAVSKKDQDISEDLKIHLQQANNYILLVDDANRQLLNFKQILGIFKEKRQGNIKLIITVRDYALPDVKNECFEYEPQIIPLNKFLDDEIAKLIASDSFEIRNPQYQRKIVEVADGNARLAIMAARIANQKQQSFLFGNVSDLYDSYFQTFIKDFNIFENKVLLKTIGIIAFFYTIDRSNKEFIKTILTNFEIDYYEFNEAINELEKRELVEVQYNHARVAEQVMATYFFYKVFIKDGILSFRTLMFNFLSKWATRFSDTIIPANNAFGYENVLPKISDVLNEYLSSIISDDEKVLVFFEIFWFYKSQEMLDYFYQKIYQLPEPVTQTYETHYETNDFVWNTDKTLDFLAKLFYHYTDNFLPSLELSFEYCRKKSEKLPELIKKIREKLLFDEEDSHFDFQRQVELFNLLIKKFKEKHLHYVEAFFALSGTFLKHYYQINKGGRNHTVTFYQYPLPFYETTKEFRESLWITIFEHFDEYPKEMLSILKNYVVRIETQPEILEFDLSLLLPFIDSKLNHQLFEHIHFVHNFITSLDREKLKNKGYKKIKMKFDSKEYQYYKKLDWNSLRGKQDFEFDNHREFERLKEDDIRKSFVFKSEEDFGLLHQAVKNTIALGNHYTYGIAHSLNIIVEENFIRNNELGFQLLKSILKNYSKEIGVLYRAIKTIVTKSGEWTLRLYNLIKTREHECQLDWKVWFFECLPKEFVNDFYSNELINTIDSIKQYCNLVNCFEKFLIVDKDIVLKIVKIVVEKNETENLRVNLPYHFFEKYSHQISDNFELLGKAYIIEEKKNNHFDFNREGLKTLIRINPQFLIEYITFFYSESENLHSRDTHNQLAFVWDLENHQTLVEKIANIVIEKEHYFGIIEHSLVIFFNHINEEQMVKAKQFLLLYITKYNADQNKMNSVFDVIRNKVNDFFEEAFLHYLNLNTDIEIFRKIWWRGNGGTYNGNVIIGEIEAKDWQKIIDIANKSKNQLALIPIKAYLKKKIESSLQSGEWERKRNFINPEKL